MASDLADHRRPAVLMSAAYQSMALRHAGARHNVAVLDFCPTSRPPARPVLPALETAR
ncbi:hypothetical protein ACFC26_30945 [Kitasatospora purpeofusca]|uniref:hypothetical protein n=1 Tax=Kitasatospora purpeofusca TaxID=67352 RepID=UPI0035D786C9